HLKQDNKHFIFLYFFCIFNPYKTVAVATSICDLAAAQCDRFLPKVSCCVPYLQVTFISNFKSLALTVLEISCLQTDRPTDTPLSQTNFFGVLRL
ncbi:hypothetical protein WDU94_005023, partial [Cyamophila willieti]